MGKIRDASAPTRYAYTGLTTSSSHGVPCSETIPTAADPEGRFQYHAERLTAAAITQTYNYMIVGGLEYGLLTTGHHACTA
ncbi:hypothetical protein BKA67DRAFT_570621, partial [Truncatella angustata]